MGIIIENGVWMEKILENEWGKELYEKIGEWFEERLDNSCRRAGDDVFVSSSVVKYCLDGNTPETSFALSSSD